MWYCAVRVVLLYVTLHKQGSIEVQLKTRITRQNGLISIILQSRGTKIGEAHTWALFTSTWDASWSLKSYLFAQWIDSCIGAKCWLCTQSVFVVHCKKHPQTILFKSPFWGVEPCRTYTKCWLLSVFTCTNFFLLLPTISKYNSYAAHLIVGVGLWGCLRWQQVSVCNDEGVVDR